MKKALVLLLVLGMILGALTPGLAEVTMLDPSLLNAADYSYYTWTSSETNRCLLTILSCVQWGNYANSSNRYEFKMGESSFVAKSKDGETIQIFFMVHDSYSGDDDYVTFFYTPHLGTAGYSLVEDCTSSVLKLMLAGTDSVSTYYENDIETILTVGLALKDAIGS